MKILHRYIISELIPPLLFGVFIFTFILLMDRLFVLAELIFTKGVPLDTAMKLLSLYLPSILAVTIPMAMLLGALVAFGRLSGDNEITALRSNGISLYHFIIPVLLFSLTVSLFLVFFYDRVLPMGNFAAKKLLFDIVRTRASIAIDEGVFNTDFDNLIIYIQEKDDKTNRLRGVTILKNERDRPLQTIIAREGQLVNDPSRMLVTLELKNGYIHQTDGIRLDRYHQFTFQKLFINLNIGGLLNRTGGVSKGLREMTMNEIASKIKSSDKKSRDINYDKVELYKRVSYPFAAVVFVLIGAPLGVQARRGGTTIGFGLSLLVILVYYIFLTLGEDFGSRGTIHPEFSVWIANIVIGTAGMFLTIQTIREASPALSRWTNAIKMTTKEWPLTKWLLGRKKR